MCGIILANSLWGGGGAWEESENKESGTSLHSFSAAKGHTYSIVKNITRKVQTQDSQG
jgi:hypothetical protein